MHKHALAILIAVLTFNLTEAQTVTVDGKDINKIRSTAKYVTITGSLEFGGGWKVSLHFGQGYNVGDGFTDKNLVFTDRVGNKIIFNSLADVLNFMYDWGYEYVGVTESGAQQHYIFRRID